MAILRIPGMKDEHVSSAEFEGKRAGGLLSVKSIGAYRIDVARAAAGEEVTLKDVAEDDLVEVELEGGVRLWTSVAQLREDLGESGVARGGTRDELVIPTQLPFGTPSRGIGTWVLKALRIFTVEMAEETAVDLAEKLESRMEPGPGLYRCKVADRCELTPLKKNEVPFADGAPGLLFIHGTASSTDGSFGGLWEPEQRPILEALNKQYQGNLFAFQHRSLTQSPIENAVELATRLSPGARLHIVTHSRGGLVGELLCRGSLEGDRLPFVADELNLFAANERKRDLAAMKQLNDLLKSKRFQVERFVRVACPARGTTLASERLDRYLSIILNAIGLIPVLRANPIYDFVSDFLIAVIKTRTKPDELPGLEAMMPKSPLIKILNRAGVSTDANLSVIAGDIEGEGIWGRIKVFATDLFYREDHDLVVNTRAMRGGTPRLSGARQFFDQGPEVCHFNYFRNKDTSTRLLAALQGLTGEGSGFEELDMRREISERSYGRRDGIEQPVVFVIPGIMGSHLSVGDSRIWLAPVEIARGNFAKLHIDAPGVSPEAPIGLAYYDLIKFLATSHEVIPFPYDWRRSILEEARRLGDAVAGLLDRMGDSKQPVRLLAHSMGGLVARAMIAERPEVWERLCRHPGGRLIMLGTPNSGSFVIPRMLLGRERILRNLALFDFQHNQRQLLEVVSQFPGVFEMLPVQEDDKYFDLATWKELQGKDQKDWVLPAKKLLDQARAFRKVLDDSPPVDVKRLAFVAGCAPATPIDLKIEEGNIQFLATGRGDGRVPWEGCAPAGVPVWYMDTSHGNLADYRPAFQALLDLLQNGSTNRLPSTPPVVERGAVEHFLLPDDEPDIFPDAEEMAAAALGFAPKRREFTKIRQVRVSVAHGNLGFAHHPVAVGHYQGDTIISAEAYLDRSLDGRLRERLRLGLYPGAIETAEVFLNPGGKPGGAIVIGLGRVGELTPGKLTASFTRAALMYAAQQRENVAVCKGKVSGERITATLTTLLIGTGAGGLSVQDSVAAMLRAVLRANNVLMQSYENAPIFIEEIELIEIYADRAIQAARVLDDLMRDREFQEYFQVTRWIKNVPGGKTRATYEEDPGWWRRLQVVGEDDGSLKFNALTDRARAEVSLQPTQRTLVDRFVEKAVRDARSDPEQARTLFELLLPNRLKDQAPSRRNLVLVLDNRAAAYPWELLQDRFDKDDRPLAVEAGVIRQLQTEIFRENVVMTTLPNALVVGDPPSDDFIELKGAQEEAGEVAAILKQHNYDVTDLIRPKSHAEAVIKALFARDYRILHLAGHGVYHWSRSEHQEVCAACGTHHVCAGDKVTGMVLGTGVFLTPAEIRQMRQVPELVFINCCHLGRIEKSSAPAEGPADRHKLAANLAAELIRMGVRAVVAAGWAVNDDAAKTFAASFYREMLGGIPFGEAVRRARSETYKMHPAVNTWGAYQCYGDPDYTLTATAVVGDAGRSQKQSHSQSEVISDIDNIASSAITATEVKVKQLKNDLQRIKDDLPAEYLHAAAVRSVLGRSCSELDLFGEAIEHYRAALELEGADFPVKTIEQLANLHTRYAVALWAGEVPPDKRSPKPEKLINIAVEHLELLIRFGQTSERYSLLGSAYKRMARIKSGAGRDNALKEMIGHYRTAHELALKRSNEVNPYPLLNWLVGLQLVRLRENKRGVPKELGRWLEEAEKVAEKRDDRDPSFWNGITLTECLLLRHFAAADLADHREKIVNGYLTAYRRGASPREFRSVKEQLDFLVEMLDQKGLKKHRAALAALRDELAAAVVSG